jgi:hypothetical protein
VAELAKRPLKLIKGEGKGTPNANKIVCFNCRHTIRWYPCPRCKKREQK